MPNDLLVHPGDLITADLWNKLLSAIDRVDARIDANEARVVPDVVGDLLVTARDEIARARLELQTVLDAEGTRVDLADAALDDRIVLAQMPSPEDFVRAGRRVTLLITAAKIKSEEGPVLDKMVGVGGGTTAQLGRGLELIGNKLRGPMRVSIRNTVLGPDQFTGDNDQKITIPKVPPFEGAPPPGVTKSIPITVTNEKGSASLSVEFTEPQIPVKPPAISNVRFRSRDQMSITGTSLNPAIQDVSVTVLNDNVDFKPASDDEIVAGTSDRVQKLFANVEADTFNLLLEIDKRNLFFINFADPELNNSLRLNPRTGEPIGRVGVVSPRIAKLGTVKLFLLLSPALAKLVASSRTIRTTVTGSALTVEANRSTFRVDLTKLIEVEVVVRVADKRATFTVMIGEVS